MLITVVLRDEAVQEEATRRRNLRHREDDEEVEENRLQEAEPANLGDGLAPLLVRACSAPCVVGRRPHLQPQVQ